eukprot:2079499-Amphidinium_carterae.2
MRGYPGEGPFGRPRVYRACDQARLTIGELAKLGPECDQQGLGKLCTVPPQAPLNRETDTGWGMDTLAGVQFAAPSLQGLLKEA